jgi:ferredoxin-NADP reductase
MPALLTSSGRPGFYLRVLKEGEVGAGDEIVKVGEANERMSVAEINALLYSPDHPRDRLERALRIEALSSGWRGSFKALLQTSAAGAGSGNAGLAPAGAAQPVAPGFRSLVVKAIEKECADVISLTMESADDEMLAPPLPGQYVVLRLRRAAGGAPFFRSYSLSGPISTQRYRISVKFDPNGAGGTYLRDHVRVGDALDVSLPRGTFVLRQGNGPVVFISAGIGATPVLAMLHALSASASTRQVLWLHAARDAEHHPFAKEARVLVAALARARQYVCYSRPQAHDRLGVQFDAAGRISQAILAERVIPPDAQVYLCGPARFMTDMKAALTALGIAPGSVYAETFSGAEALNPGIVGAPVRAPHPPEDAAATGPLVSFARSGIAARWNASTYQSILELAEACDVPVRWSCRTGVCHNCESGLISGRVTYQPEPLDAPAEGNLLICCARPDGDVVIDL